jgi:hypothetical protein
VNCVCASVSQVSPETKFFHEKEFDFEGHKWGLYQTLKAVIYIINIVTKYSFEKSIDMFNIDLNVDN